jgi:hypothetical protein
VKLSSREVALIKYSLSKVWSGRDRKDTRDEAMRLWERLLDREGVLIIAETPYDNLIPKPKSTLGFMDMPKVVYRLVKAFGRGKKE